ncbi:MAG: flagellar hook-associated protein FlgK [Sulfuricella sp.]|nr:flagellar hook-associated protein FlgK [Sulfuricella sp.]
MGNSIFGIGISALNAAQAGLLTTGHNIANVNTPGYSRQQVAQSSNIPLSSGIGFIGQGAHVDTIRRIYNDVLNSQVMQAQAQSSQLDAYNVQITQIDNMLADSTAGLSPALQDFFNGVQDVASNFASTPSRQAMLSGAQAVVSRFQALDQRFQEIRGGVNGEIVSSVAEINSYAQQIAGINRQIVLAQSVGSDLQPANDLLDQRDQLIADLSKIVQVTTVKQDDGSLNVFIGKGQTLVVGQQSFALTTASSLEDPQQLEVGMDVGGSTILLGQGALQGGSLGGILAFRSEALDSAQNALGRVAIGLAQTFNDQHRLGMDQNGAMGGDFFNVSAPRVIPNALNSAGADAAVTISDAGALTTGNYRLTYDGSAWKMLNATTNQIVAMTGTGTPADPFVADGLSIVVAPPAVATDTASFLIQPTRNGARDIGVAISDTSRIAAAAPIVTNAALANMGLGKISAGSVNPPPPADANLRDNVTIAFIDPTHFSVTDNTTSTVLAASVAYDPATGASATYNGWTVQLTGAPASGDTFTVGPNTTGVSDNRNALLLAGLQTQNTLAGGTTSYQGAYSQLVSFVGNKTREVQVAAKGQANLLVQTRQAQQSVSGVNLDEEAANLMRYQQAYQAAGKMMQISSTLFDTLLSLGN